MARASHSASTVIAGAVLGGAACGVFEAIFGGVLHSPGVGVFVLATTVAVWLALGACTGVILLVVRGLVLASPIGLAALLACTASALIGLRLEILQAAALVSFAALVATLAVRTERRELLAVLILLQVILAILHPLFTGKAMVLVFSRFQILAIFLVSVPLLFLTLQVLFGDLLGGLRRRDGLDGVTAVSGLLLSALLAHFSGVFLIRLWGFNTMEYLQAAIVLLQVGATARVFWLLTLLSVEAVRPMVLLVTTVILFTITVAVASVGLARSQVSSFVLKRLPYSTVAVGLLGKALDRDGDGYTPLFGWGDCDDSNPSVHPDGIDWPGDGADQNCFNGDLGWIEMPYFNIPIRIAPPPEKREGRRIAVLIVIDTLRADAVDYRLSENDRTPNIARFASRSVDFTRGYAQSNNTLDSMPFLLHMSFRGLPRYNREWTLPHLLSRGSVQSTAVLQSSVQEWWGPDMDPVLLGFDTISRPELSVRNRSSADTVAAALAAIRAPGDRDLFVFLHFEALHDYATQSMEGGRMIVSGLNISEFAGLLRPEKFRELMRARYDATLREIDSALGPLFEELNAPRGPSEDMLMILTSDHGEEFLEHGGFFHMGTLYEEVVRVPYLVGGTTIAARQENRPVGHYRITPTILDFLGFRGEFLDKVGLLKEPLNPYTVFSYFTRAGERNVMLLAEEYKLLYDLQHHRTELYDLARDPHETNDLVGRSDRRAELDDAAARMDTLMFYLNYGDVELFKLRQQLEARR